MLIDQSTFFIIVSLEADELLNPNCPKYSQKARGIVYA